MSEPLACSFVTILTLLFFQGCEYHDLDDPGVIDATDESLFEEANAEGFIYYQNGTLFPATSQGAHGAFKLKFNEQATTALGADGRLMKNARFPEGSVLVKEVYYNSTLGILAVMKRAQSDIHAREGWLWAEYYVDGRPAIGLEDNGRRCVSCHSQTPNRDLVRTFDIH